MPVMLRLSVPLFCSDNVPTSPETLPPTLNVLGMQVTLTLVKLAPLAIPAPLATVQVWPIGCADTATLY